MKKTTLLLASLITLLLGSANVHAFTKETHRRIAEDAVAYMQRHPSTTNYLRFKAAVNAAGYSVTQAASIIGQGAFDVDDFRDTYLCGAITGDCVEAPLWGIGTDFVNYTAFHHFQDHTNGSDAHGNDLGGYNYSKLNVWGTIDTAAASWLWNDHLDDGWGGMTGTCWWAFGWHCSEDSEYNSYGITEAHYRQGGYSSKSMYDDYQDIPWQPIDNLGQYWYSQFLTNPSLQTLGFVMHTTDVLQPHHTWNTLDLNHSGWESWVADNYYSENLNSDALVTTALGNFSPVSTYSSQIRPLITQGGSISYQYGGSVLTNTDHGSRVQVARTVVPHAIAMVVRILNHAADRM